MDVAFLQLQNVAKQFLSEQPDTYYCAGCKEHLVYCTFKTILIQLQIIGLLCDLGSLGFGTQEENKETSQYYIAIKEWMT